MTTDAANPDASPYDPRQYRSKLFPVVLAVAFFYFAAILLNANGIKRDIELMQYGKLRDAALAVFSPVAGFSNRLGLTRFRTIIENSIGKRLCHETITH